MVVEYHNKRRRCPNNLIHRSLDLSFAEILLQDQSFRVGQTQQKYFLHAHSFDFADFHQSLLRYSSRFSHKES